MLDPEVLEAETAQASSSWRGPQKDENTSQIAV